MDKTTFKESILADNIQKWEQMNKKELLNVLIQQKWDELERMSDQKLISQIKPD